MSTVAAYARAWKFQLNSPYTATNTIFVDSFAGDDVRGNGTMAFPFQTLNKAVVYANANGKPFIVCRGYFSELVMAGYSKNVMADQLGDFIFDGQNLYYVQNLTFTAANEKTGCILTNLFSNSNYAVSNSIYVNALGTNNNSLGGTRNAFRGIIYSLNSNYGVGTLQYSIVYNCSFIDYSKATRTANINGGTKCIYDNCKIYLDTNNTVGAVFTTCLFRVNCTFWKKNASTGVDERVDADGMTAAQKYAAVMDWVNNGTCYTSTYKIAFTNCQFTDNKIFNCPDNDQSGTSWDFSLIYGTKEAQPACYMDGGKHIGAFPPSVKIEFKNTVDLTTSMYEVEIKTTDNINNVNGVLSLGANFTGATLYSKPMLIPLGTQFNGFNLSLFPDAASSGVFVSGQTDSIDMSEANRLTINSAGVALTSGVCYLVRIGTGSSVVYNGTAYADKTVLMATDSTTLATSTGSNYLYPMPHPSIWQNVLYKVCETAVVPDDFKTNDTAYPWMAAECFTKPADVRGTNETGLRCLRAGNVNSGAIDLGSDGKPLTSAHPEYYNTTNQARTKFFVRANYVMLKITINRFFS
jgi:hypothetical protein